MAARMLTAAQQQRDHITPVLADLHWLSVSQLIIFKMALLVWKCVRGVAPAYLSDFGIPATAIARRQHLPSTMIQNSAGFTCPDHNVATLQQSFALNGLTTWNRQSPELQSPDLSQNAFKQLLKTYLFSTDRRH